MIEIIKVGKKYTTVVFKETIYGSYGMIKYVAGEEYLIPNSEVDMWR